jgi:peptidoglycan-associated lipoprotein
MKSLLSLPSNIKKYLPASIIHIVMISLILGSSACSMFGSSKGGGDSDTSLTDEALSLGQDSRFGSGNIPVAAARETGPFSDIHFAFDSSSVDPRYYDMLKESAQQLIKDPTLKTEVEGHCDSRGTHEYNLALGEERAKSVARLLKQYGVNGKQITTISYGAEIPLDPAQNEAAYAKNRRVHFALFREKK